MINWSINLKEALENTFSMPFDVSQTVVDGERRYICCPQNNEKKYFSVLVYIHEQIRLLVEIEPQEYGRGIMNDMSQADPDKKACFFEYLEMLHNKGCKIHFSVNGVDLNGSESWPNVWRIFSCKISKIPIEVNSEEDELSILSEWMRHGVNIIFSLLTIDENDISHENMSVQNEGAKYQQLSVRYERSPINRELCLYKKGYTCAVCGTNLFEEYGEIGRKYIEVHHTTPVSLMGENYRLDIDRDLVPLCPNCHAMVHRKTPPYDIKELKSIWERQNYGYALKAAEPLAEYNKVSNVLVGVVKEESISYFKNGEARIYYFGKKFPSKYNIKEIQYFAPYYNGGVRGYYDVKSIRTAWKSEFQNLSGQDDETRIVLDLGDYHPISETPIKAKLAFYAYAFIPLQELIDKRENN